MKYFKVKNFNLYNKNNIDNIKLYGFESGHYNHIEIFITGELLTQKELTRKIDKYNIFAIDGDYIRRFGIDKKELVSVLFEEIEHSKQKTISIFGVRKII